MNANLEWLLEDENPSVKYFTQTRILSISPSSKEVQETIRQIAAYEPVQEILSRQDSAGWWHAPDRAASPMYLGTTWQLMLLAELGYAPGNERIQKGADFIFPKVQKPDGALDLEAERYQKKIRWT